VIDWIDPAAAATCEMVTLLLPRLGVPLDALEGAIATNLLAGVVIDTATFQHPNTTPRTLRVGAELVAVGAPLSDISRRLYRTKPNPQLQLFGIVLARMEASPDGGIVWSTLSADDLSAASASPEMSEGLIDLLAQSATADVAILFKDQGTRTRMSVRTRDGGVDAIELTGRFGGGGHMRAAGATIEQPSASAIREVLAEAGRLVDRLRGRVTTRPPAS
jgi:phosphoesterase RecJ-like protein